MWIEREKITNGEGLSQSALLEKFFECVLQNMIINLIKASMEDSQGGTFEHSSNDKWKHWKRDICGECAVSEVKWMKTHKWSEMFIEGSHKKQYELRRNG